MPRLCLTSNTLEAKFKPFILAIEAIGDWEIEAKFTVEFSEVGVIEDEERVHCPKDIIFFIDIVQSLYDWELYDE